MIKKLIIPLLMALSLVGCGESEYSWVVKISDREVSPQEYVSAQMHAYIEARNMADYSEDVLDGNIDGVSTSQWITDHTLDRLKRNIFIEDEFEKRNLKFGTDADEYIHIFAEEGWVSVSKMYKNNGLEFDYYLDYLRMLYKEQLVFNSIYVYGEENKVTDREIEDYLANNLCRVSYFRVARVNDDGSALTADQDTQLDAMVADAVKSINSGRAIATVAGELLTQSGLLLGSAEDFSDGASFITTEYITSSSVTLIFDFMENFFTIDQDQCVYYKMGDCYYICQKRPLCDTQVEYMYLKQDVVNLIRDVEFEEMIACAADQMEVEYHPEAIKEYTPQKLKMIVE